jgi:hypothetical protein
MVQSSSFLKMGSSTYQFNHLTPSSRPCDAEHVSQVMCPPVGMDASCHHSGVDKIEIMGWEREPAGGCQYIFNVRCFNFLTGDSNHQPANTSSLVSPLAFRLGLYRHL